MMEIQVCSKCQKMIETKSLTDRGMHPADPCICTKRDENGNKIES